jgi:hypothetical protein
MSKFDLAKFAEDIEAAFFLIGADKSKATYDWMVTMQERQRIIELLENARYLCSTEKGCWTSYDNGCECQEVIALIKGEK